MFCSVPDRDSDVGELGPAEPLNHPHPAQFGNDASRSEFTMNLLQQMFCCRAGFGFTYHPINTASLK